MSSIVSRTVMRSALRVSPRALVTTFPRRTLTSSIPRNPEREQDKKAILKGARRDPELIVLFVIMSSIFALAGWHFARNPTMGPSERPVAKIPDSEPWKDGGSHSGQYKFAPHGDLRNGTRDAPNALNEVIIPDVTMPKHLHDRFNKFGKEGY